MATVTRTSVYPSALDTTANMPSVVNGEKTDASQNNALRDAIIQLEAMVGATSPAVGSMNYRVNVLENLGEGSAGTAGGDLSGAFTEMRVEKLQGHTLYTAGAKDAYVLTYSTSRGQWEAAILPPATGTLDRALIAVDHSHFSEATNSFVTKKYRDIVNDSDKPFAKIRAVLGLWREGGSVGNTVEAQLSLGGYSTTVSTASSTEAICAVEVGAYVTQNTVSTIYVALKKVDAGITAAHMRYCDIFAIYQ